MTRRTAIWIFIAAFFVLIIAAAANSKEEGSAPTTSFKSEGRTYNALELQDGEGRDAKKVAIVPVIGVITPGDSDPGGGSVGSEDLIRQLDEISQDDEYDGIILEVDTPGGGVLASDEASQAVRRAQERGLKVVAWMRDTAASGGYYISAPADRIVAAPSTITGSIGVILQYFNVQELGTKIGVKPITIKSGKMKDIGSPYNELTEEERALLQELIDEAYGDFLQVVSDGRDIDLETLRPIADGRIYTGRQALENGLVDELGGRREAYDAMSKLLKAGDEDGDELEIVRFHRSFDFWDSVSAASSSIGGLTAQGLAAELLGGPAAPATTVANDGLPHVEYRAVL